MTLPYNGNTITGLVVSPFEGVFSPNAFTNTAGEVTANSVSTPRENSRSLGAVAAANTVERLDSSLDHIM